MEKKKNGLALMFEKAGQLSSFTPSEMHNMRPGCFFHLMPRSILERNTANADHGADLLDSEWPVLASILPLQTSRYTQLSLMIFRREVFAEIKDIDSRGEGGVWLAKPVTTLISQIRQFEVCIRQPHVSFMDKLLARGNKQIDKNEENMVVDTAKLESFLLPSLNSTQYRAINAFVSGPLSTLSLVQGPPGTGKTTFLVSLIFHCLFSSTIKDLSSAKRNPPRITKAARPSKRIMVTAPTNKAILVVTKRFIDIWKDDPDINVVLVGVEDKLIPEDEEDPSRISTPGIGPQAALLDPTDSSYSSLRGIFAYTWMDNMIECFTAVQSDLQAGMYNHAISSRLQFLIQKLNNSIPNCAGRSGVSEVATDCLSAIQRWIGVHVRQSLAELISRLHDIDPTECISELLSTANVIFCTLSTAGISLLKKSTQIDDLFIDEAAAATEAECCIPFLLRPSRLLAVGDPMQLPATVFSQHAKSMGLDKSMHHRLMYECNCPYIMLDTQYR